MTTPESEREADRHDKISYKVEGTVQGVNFR